MLMREDMFLPGYRYEDPDDLAKSAGVSASSQAQVWVNPSETYLKTENDFFFTVPGAERQENKNTAACRERNGSEHLFLSFRTAKQRKAGQTCKGRKKKNSGRK